MNYRRGLAILRRVSWWLFCTAVVGTMLLMASARVEVL